MKTYNLIDDPSKQFGAIYLIDKEAIPTDWDAIMIVSLWKSYTDKLITVIRVNILEDKSLLICPEEVGEQEFNYITDKCEYLYTAPSELMSDLISLIKN